MFSFTAPAWYNRMNAPQKLKEIRAIIKQSPPLRLALGTDLPFFYRGERQLAADFEGHVASEYSVENLHFIRALYRISENPVDVQRDLRRLYNRYIKAGSLQEINIDSPIRHALTQSIEGIGANAMDVDIVLNHFEAALGQIKQLFSSDSASRFRRKREVPGMFQSPRKEQLTWQQRLDPVRSWKSRQAHRRQEQVEQAQFEQKVLSEKVLHEKRKRGILDDSPRLFTWSPRVNYRARKAANARLNADRNYDEYLYKAGKSFYHFGFGQYDTLRHKKFRGGQRAVNNWLEEFKQGQYKFRDLDASDD